jgi:hypothetical protein
MFTTSVDKKTLGETNGLLISGASLKDTAELTGLTYAKVSYLRKKLVKAGALQPLYKTTRKARTSRKIRTEKTSVLGNSRTVNQPQSNFDGIKLVINGTELNIRNAKSVDVSTGLVDIKY